MPVIPIIMPQLGESIAEAAVVSFLVKPGESVEADQDIIEVETSKATLNLVAPCGGKIDKFIAKLSESYPVGATLGYLEASVEAAAKLGLDVPAPESSGRDAEKSSAAERSEGNGESKKVQPTIRGLPVPANVAGASYMSPRMKARIAELGLHAADLAGIAGSGSAGRVTSRTSKSSLISSRRAFSARRPRCAWQWRTRCDAVGRVRWRRLRCQFALTRCWRIEKFPARNLVRPFTG